MEKKKIHCLCGLFLPGSMKRAKSKKKKKKTLP